MKKILFEHIGDNQFKLIKEGDDTYEFARGLKWGMNHKREGGTLDSILINFPNMSSAFIKGYKKGRNDPKWQRFNAALTDYIGRLGSSLVRR